MKEYYLICQSYENLDEYDYPPQIMCRVKSLWEAAAFMKSKFEIEKWNIEEYAAWMEERLNEDGSYFKIFIDEYNEMNWYINEIEWIDGEVTLDS